MPLLSGTCQSCGTEFKYHSSHAKGKFCSQECFHNQNVGKNHFRYTEKETVTCIQCGERFKVWPSIADKRQFCSIKCKADWQSEHLKGENNPNWKDGITKTKRTCKNCGDTFYVFTHLLKQQPCVFCSNACSTDYLENHPKIKNRIYRKIFKARAMRPNKPEKELIKIIDDNELPYRYVGDGTVVIGGRCPDFSNTQGERKLIELFGYYWHSPKYRPNIRYARTLEGTQEHYMDYGYKCLVFWEDEIEEEKEVVERIKSFTGDVTCVY